MTHSSIRRLALAILAALAVAATASGSSTVRRFYQDKNHTTTPEAFERARQRLDAVRIGMPEPEFLETMQMRALNRGERVLDVYVDGYLAETSRRFNEAADDPEQRHLVFGFVADDQEVPRALVILRDRHVHDVATRDDTTPRAGALLAEKGSTPD